MTSRVPNFGPYDFPDVVLLKICPSSPWYAYESGSQPGILLNATLDPENPMPIILLHWLSALLEHGVFVAGNVPILALGNNCHLIVVDTALPWHGVVSPHRSCFIVCLLGPRELGLSAIIFEIQLGELVAFVPLGWPARDRLIRRGRRSLDDLVGQAPVRPGHLVQVGAT